MYGGSWTKVPILYALQIHIETNVSADRPHAGAVRRDDMSMHNIFCFAARSYDGPPPHVMMSLARVKVGFLQV